LVQINRKLCVGCTTCIPYCPVEAFKKETEERKVHVDEGVCTNCYVCIRNNVCPVGAIEESSLDGFMKQFQHVISDPTVTSEGTGVPGRGTEEAKTNDVTGRYGKGEFGICIDMGRPGIGCRLQDAEKVAMAVAQAGLMLEGPETTPLAMLMTDIKTGKLIDEALDTNVLSVIIEGKCPKEKLPDVLMALQRVEKDIETTFCLGIVSRAEQEDVSFFFETLEKLGIPKPFRGKVNVGLGRPLIP